MPGVKNKFPNPSAFSHNVSALSYRLCELNGHAPRTQATQAPKATLAQTIVPDAGVIQSMHLKALEVGTTSSATFNTVAVFRVLRGSPTVTQIGIARTRRGFTEQTEISFSGATQLVSPGDMLVIRRLTKLNTGSQLFVSMFVDKNVNPS